MPYAIKVKTTFPGGTKSGVNVWHVRKPDPLADDPTLQPPCDAIAAFYASLKTQFGSTYSWTWDGSATEVGTATPHLVGGLTGFSHVGSAGGNTSSGPAGVGLCVSWRSSLASRRGRGRTFITPLPTEKWQTDGTLDDTFLATVRGYAAALVTASRGLGNGAVGIWSPTDSLFRDVVGSSINDRAAWLSTRRS